MKITARRAGLHRTDPAQPAATATSDGTAEGQDLQDLRDGGITKSRSTNSDGQPDAAGEPPPAGPVVPRFAAARAASANGRAVTTRAAARRAAGVGTDSEAGTDTAADSGQGAGATGNGAGPRTSWFTGAGRTAGPEAGAATGGGTEASRAVGTGAGGPEVRAGAATGRTAGTSRTAGAGPGGLGAGAGAANGSRGTSLFAGTGTDASNGAAGSKAGVTGTGARWTGGPTAGAAVEIGALADWPGGAAWPTEDELPPPSIPGPLADVAPPELPTEARPAWRGLADRLRIPARRVPFWTDALLVDGLAALGLLGIASAHVKHPLIAVIAVALQSLPVLLRRRYPLLALIPVVAAGAEQRWTEHLITGAALGVLVLLADVARARDVRRDLLAVVVIAIPAIGLTLLGKVSADEFVLLHVAFFGSMALGDTAGRRVEDRSRRVEEERRAAFERDREIRRAMAEERVNIARELHDVSAHTFGVIGVQAQAALRNLDEKPDRSRKSLGIVLGVTVQAANDVRRLVGFLRGADASAAPQPTLAELDLLVERMAELGLPVEVHRELGDATLSPALEASAYRIVEESLLNTVRHANADQASVTVRCRPGWLDIDVVDNGSGAAPESREGQGLVGMRERVALFDGALHTGAGAGGTGYRVRAALKRDDGGAS